MSKNNIPRRVLYKIQEAKKKQFEKLDLSYYRGHQPLTEIPGYFKRSRPFFLCCQQSKVV